MNIGIDARLLSLPLTGIGRYTLEMCRELVQSGDRYFLYSPTPILHGDWQRPNVTLRTACLNGRAGRMLWAQAWLPCSVRRDALDMFWGTTHRLPAGLPSTVARVVTIHDLVWKHAGDTMRPLSRFTEQRLMPAAVARADRIVADSHSTAQAIAEEYPVAHGKVSVVYPGVSRWPAPAGPEALRRLGIARPYVLFVGTQEPRKNLERLLAAYASLPEGVRQRADLVIAGGPGWGGVDAAGLARRLGVAGQVHLPGYVAEADLATLYAHARLLAMPSLYEGFGLPVVEAHAFGVPALVSDVSSLPEVAGDAGLQVDPRDVSAIAQGLARLLCDNALHARLATRARANAARFDWGRAASELHAIFAAAARR